MTLNVKRFARIVRSVQDSHNDCIIAITGFRGVGKSVLMRQIGKELKLCDYDMNKYHIYSRKELVDNLEKLEKKDILCVDEAINTIFKREFQKKNQIQIIKMFNTYRDKFFTVFLLVPLFWDLDSSVRNSMMIKFWIFCYKKGRAVIFTHNHNPATTDPFNRDSIHYAWARKRIRTSRNYFNDLRWSNLKPEEYDLYAEIKARKRKESYNQEDDTAGITKADTVRSLMFHNPNLTASEITKITGFNRSYVYDLYKASKEKIKS